MGDATATEGTAMTFTVSLDRQTSLPVAVHYATGNGTATAPGDYVAASGDLTFTPGETSKQVSVQTAVDTVDELNETFNVMLSGPFGGPFGGKLGDATGVGTIVDDDRDGDFACAARALGAVTANPSYTPCEDDAKQAAPLDVNLGLLRVQVAGLQAGTEASDDEATSTARLSTTRISTIGLTVELGDSPPSLAPPSRLGRRW